MGKRNKYFLKEEIQMDNKYMKNVQYALPLGKGNSNYIEIPSYPN
jgi:hypothetical protein